ncbi:hypothetical protein ABMA28_000166 [Loxostege sticticalis]|uniref:Alpha-1,3-mannosyl-glycoprotein 4-beta-N-acetylglucosaminyltransferase A n=1 Tax=Loxostege sticticalis TaxID=481309 RepID=A0ABD0TRC8_LOXSC
MHFLGDRTYYGHITLRKRLLLIFMFCVGLFTMSFFKTVEVVQSRVENTKAQYLYEACEEKLRVLEAQTQTPVHSKPSKLYRRQLSTAIQLQLSKMNGTKASKGFQHIKPLDSSNFIFPHLSKDSEGLIPAYHMNSNRNMVDIVIGVPTVKRDRGNYLNRTLRDLMDGVVDDQTTILVIVMIGEIDLKYVLDTALAIEKEFPHEIETGLLQIISPSEAYYPNIETLPATFSDSAMRTRWRAKLVMDRVFLMAYGHTKGSFYLMMEDDFVAKKSYTKAVKSYISYCTQTKPDWLVIEFSHYFGSVGKLFRSYDVRHFILYLQLFYYNKPLELLIENYLEDKACGKIKTTEQCFNNIAKIRIKNPSSLFLHIGKYMKVEESKAVAGHTFFPHENPPLKGVVSDIKELPFHTAKMAYNGEYIFMGVYPEAGDVIEFWFQNPTELKSYLFQTGNYQNTNDLLKKADVEVLPAGGFRHNFTKVGSFDEFGLAKGNLDNFGPLDAIRLRVTDYGLRDSGKVVISEIELVPKDAKKLN